MGPCLIFVFHTGSWQIRYSAFEKYKTAGWDKIHTKRTGAVPGWRRMLLWIRLQISDWTFRFKMWEPTSTKNWHTHIDLPFYPSNSQLTNLFWIFYNISLNIVIHISIFSINKSPQKKEPDGPDAKVTPCKRHRQAPPYGYEIKTRKNSFIKQTFQFPHSYFASLHSFLLINLLPESKVCFTKFPVSPFVPEIEAKSRFYCSTPVTLRALVVKRAKRRLCTSISFACPLPILPPMYRYPWE